MLTMRRYIEQNNLYQKAFNLSVVCSIGSTTAIVIGSVLSSPAILAGSMGLFALSVSINLCLLESGRVRSGSGNPYDNDDDVVEEELSDE